MITLYQFFRIIAGELSGSPFCLKLETYLRMAKLPYENKWLEDARSAPKGKLPYIQLDGKNYADSELIIDDLKIRYGNSLDQHLTQEQRALSVLIESIFHDRWPWLAAYMVYKYQPGWQSFEKLVKEMFEKKLETSSFRAFLLPLYVFGFSMIRKKVIKRLDGIGYGLHSVEEIVHLWEKTIDALSRILGSQAYFLGDKPSSIDATAFGFITQVVMNAPYFSAPDSPLRPYLLKKENLSAYCNRMWDEFYSEYAKPSL